MSKGKILESLGDGKYKVEVFTDVEAINERVKTIDDLLVKLNHDISYDLKTAVDDALVKLKAMPLDDIPALALARHEYDKAVDALAKAKIERENLLDEKAKLKEVKPSVIKELWCADYNTELQKDSDVGVLDWYNFREPTTSNRFVLVPAYINETPENVYNGIRDGRLAPAFTLSPNAWWYAWSVAAGMERYNPRYRKGTITAIADNGRCDVTVDENYTQIIPHTAQKLTTRELHLKNVPVRYLSCDALAFQVDDRVVLEYPRKNVHKDILAVFEAKKADWLKKSADLQKKIDAIVAKSVIQKAFIKELDDYAKLLADTIKTENDAGGITDLQNEVDTLNDQVTSLNQQISTEKQDNDTLINEVTSLEKQITDKTAQILSLQDELAQLTDPVAITDKEAEITTANNELNALAQSLIDKRQLLAESTATLTDLESQLKTARTLLNEKQNQLIPLVSVNTLSKQQLKYTLEKSVEETNKLRELEDSKFDIEQNKTDVDSQLIMLDERIIKEHTRFETVKKFADTRPKEITVVGFESNPKPCGIHLTMMKVNGDAGQYTDKFQPPFQTSKQRIIYDSAVSKTTVSGIYAGGNARRIAEIELPIGSKPYPHSEGGSWRGNLKPNIILLQQQLEQLIIELIDLTDPVDIAQKQYEIDLKRTEIEKAKNIKDQFVAVSWSYFDEDNHPDKLEYESLTGKQIYKGHNNCRKEYVVYIGGRFGLLPYFLAEDTTPMSVAGMCLKIGTEGNKYNLVVIYRTNRDNNTIPYVATFSVEKQGKNGLIIAELSRLALSLESNNWNHITRWDDSLADQTYTVTEYLREFTGFTDDGLHICVRSVRTVNGVPASAWNPCEDIIELVKFNTDHSGHTVQIAYLEPSSQESPWITGENLQIFADYDRFCGYKKYATTDNRQSIDAIDIIEIPIDGFWFTKIEKLGGIMPKPPENAVEEREMTFISTKLNIYQYYTPVSVTTGDNTVMTSIVVTFIDGTKHQHDLVISDHNIITTDRLSVMYRPRWMNAPYTDKLLILATFDPYAPTNALFINLETNEVTEKGVIDADIDYNISPIALMHLPF